MQIYFVASSRLVGKNIDLYSKMYKFIAEDHKMVSDTVWKWVKLGVEDLSQAPIQIKKNNYEQVLKSIHKTDIVIMEVSGHSMSMGYIISQALKENKPVIALYKNEANPIFIKGITNPKLILAEYTEDDLEKIIRESIKKAKALVDMRFNFFVSPRILNYLDWVGQKRMIPKAVFLRNLIEREMKKDRDFKG